MNKDKIKLTILIIIFSVVFLTFGLWVRQEWKNSMSFTLSNLAVPFLLVFIVLLIIPVILRNYKSIKQNVPVEDERSKKATMKAASLSYFISIYVFLAIGWLGDDYFERASQATGLGIGIMAIVFILLLLYFQRRGKL
ncbi:MAG: DUF2178 domain-containing protein [bacterium]